MKLDARVRGAVGAVLGRPVAYGAEHLHLCQPEDFEVAGTPMLRDRHPLFRRPAHVGENRHRVSAEGWEWFARPPSEQEL